MIGCQATDSLTTTQVKQQAGKRHCTYMCFQVDGVAAFLEMLELGLAGVWVDGPDALHHLLRVLLHTAQLQHHQQEVVMITTLTVITNKLCVQHTTTSRSS